MEGIDDSKVGAWLEANVPGFEAPYQYELITGGHSNLRSLVSIILEDESCFGVRHLAMCLKAHMTWGESTRLYRRWNHRVFRYQKRMGSAAILR